MVLAHTSPSHIRPLCRILVASYAVQSAWQRGRHIAGLNKDLHKRTWLLIEGPESCSSAFLFCVKAVIEGHYVEHVISEINVPACLRTRVAVRPLQLDFIRPALSVDLVCDADRYLRHACCAVALAVPERWSRLRSALSSQYTRHTKLIPSPLIRSDRFRMLLSSACSCTCSQRISLPP